MWASSAVVKHYYCCLVGNSESHLSWQKSTNLATYINDIRVHKARYPLIHAHNSSILIVSAIAVAPTTRLAEFNALLTSVAQHVVQPDFP